MSTALSFASRALGRLVEEVQSFSKGILVGRPSSPASGSAAGMVAPISYIEHRITHDDFVAAATSETEAITGFPTNAAPLFAEIKVETDFAGGAVSAATVTVGDAGSANELLTSTSVFTGVQNTAWIQTVGASLNSDFQREAAYSPILTLATTNGNTADLTAGSLIVRIYYVLLPE
jgi:hypothetical protein